MLKTITFNGRNLSDFGLYISAPGIYNAAGRRYEQKDVPGRNGAVYVTDGTLEPLEVTYTYFIKNNVKQNFDKLKDFLYRTGGVFYRITDDYNPETYREGGILGPLQIEPGWGHSWGQGEITFTCSPERYFFTEPETIAAGASTTATAPTGAGGAFRAKPIITVTGIGAITIAGANINVIDLPQTGVLYIDTNGRFATDGAGVLCDNCLGRVAYWPELQGGETIENNTNGAATVEYRWWTV